MHFSDFENIVFVWLRYFRFCLLFMLRLKLKKAKSALSLAKKALESEDGGQLVIWNIVKWSKCPYIEKTRCLLDVLQTYCTLFSNNTLSISFWTVFVPFCSYNVSASNPICNHYMLHAHDHSNKKKNKTKNHRHTHIWGGML